MTDILIRYINKYKDELNIHRLPIKIYFENGSNNYFYLIKTFLYQMILKSSDINSNIKISSCKNYNEIKYESVNCFIKKYNRNNPNDYYLKNEDNSYVLLNNNTYIYILTINNMYKIHNLIRELSNIIQFINIKVNNKQNHDNNCCNCCNRCNNDVNISPNDIKIPIELFCLLIIFGEISLFSDDTQKFNTYKYDDIHVYNNLETNNIFKQNLEFNSLNLLLNIFLKLITYHSITNKALPTIELETIELYNKRNNIQYNINNQIIYNIIKQLFEEYKKSYYINTFWSCLYSNISLEENPKNNIDIDAFYKKTNIYIPDKDQNRLYYMLYKIYFNKINICNNENKCLKTDCESLQTNNNNKLYNILYKIKNNNIQKKKYEYKQTKNDQFDNNIINSLFNQVNIHEIIELFSFKI